MTEQEALSILGGDENFVEEYVTQEVFSLKTNLLKGALVPQVINKKADKLIVMSEALVALGYENEEVEPIETSIFLKDRSSESFLNFYRQYEEKSSELKLRLMQAFHPRIIAQLIQSLALLEDNKFRQLFNIFSEIDENDQTKISEYIDSGSIITEIKSQAPFQDLSTVLMSTPTLKKEINKSIKYCKFVNAKKSR